MLKKTIKYTDFNGVEQVEDFYFNLSKADIAEVNLRTEGGLVKHLQTIAASDNGDVLVTKFKELIEWSYGVKSEDGRRFIKNKEVWTEFTQTNAYSELFMELATDQQAATDFVEGIVPEDLKSEIPSRPTPQDHKQKELPTSTGPVETATPDTNSDSMKEYLAWKESQKPTQS
jgi:hypothetical protein